MTGDTKSTIVPLPVPLSTNLPFDETEINVLIILLLLKKFISNVIPSLILFLLLFLLLI